MGRRGRNLGVGSWSGGVLAGLLVVVVGAQAQVVVGQPVIIQRPAFDPFQDALGRLRSKHDNSRRDGALTLGRIGDPRAVPDLVWLLRQDGDPDVRTAAAFALGAIGDPRAADMLRYAATFDRNRKVRQAAAHAYGRLTFAPAPVAVPGPVPAPITSEPVLAPATSTVPPPIASPLLPPQPSTLPPLAPPASELPTTPSGTTRLRRS